MSRTIYSRSEATGRKSNRHARRDRSQRIPRHALIDWRDHCMVAIARFSSQPGDWGSLFEKARQLLTRRWSASSWRARADILRTAEWLVGIGKKGADPTSIVPIRLRRACIVALAIDQRRSKPMARAAADWRSSSDDQPWTIFLDIMPVLAMGLAIVCVPLLADGPPRIMTMPRNSRHVPARENASARPT